MKKIAAGASTSPTKDQATGEAALLGNEVVQPTGAISVDDSPPPFTPVEQAILDMDTQLRSGMSLIREIKNQTAMLETAFKLMTYELTVIAKNLKAKE